MATWYVRPVGGSYGAADGTSYATAFDGFLNVDWTASGVSAGDTLYICGDHRQAFTVGGSGTSGSEITIRGDYASDPGTINGSVIKANASFTLTGGQTNTYEQAHTLGASLSMMLWEDDTRLTEQNSIANVEANAGSFWQDTVNNKIYVHPTGSTSPITNGSVYEVPSLYTCIDFNEKNYVHVVSVDAFKTCGDNTTYGGVKLNGTGCVYSDSNVYNHRRHCLQIISPAYDTHGRNLVMYDAFVSTVASMFRAASANVLDHCTIEDSVLHDGVGLAVMHGANTTYRITNSGIVNCELYNSSGVNFPLESYESDYCFAVGNYFHGTISNNICNFKNAHTALFYLSANIFDMTSVTNTYDGIFINATPNIHIFNNIIFGDNNRAAIRFYNGGTNGRVYNNIAYAVDRFLEVDVASQTNFSSDGNCLYNLNTRFGTWGVDTQANLAAWQSAASQDANSITSDPLFASFATGDYSLTALSPCIGAGRRGWGVPPLDYNQNPYPSIDIDMGIYQGEDSTNYPFHPLNL